MCTWIRAPPSQIVEEAMYLLSLWKNSRSDFQAPRFRSLSSQVKLLPILICVALTSGCNWFMYRGNALRNGHAVTDTSKLTARDSSAQHLLKTECLSAKLHFVPGAGFGTAALGLDGQRRAGALVSLRRACFDVGLQPK